MEMKTLFWLLRKHWILLGPPVLLLAAWLIGRHLGWLPKRRALPGRHVVGNRITHKAEAIMLLCITVPILVFAATNRPTGGYLLSLDQLGRGFAVINVTLAAATAVCVLGGVLLALFWRTSTGVILAAGGLAAYGLILNGPGDILESLAPEDSAKSEASWRYVLDTPDVEGAQLFVNGVHLGTLPYETTRRDFLQTVPVWQDEPKDSWEWLAVPSRWYPNSEHFEESLCPLCP